MHDKCKTVSASVTSFCSKHIIYLLPKIKSIWEKLASPPRGNICVPLSRQSSGAGGCGKAPVLPWSMPFSTARTTLGTYSHKGLGAKGCRLFALLKRNWNGEKRHSSLFLVRFGAVSCLAVFVNEQELLSWRNMCFHHQCILTEKYVTLKALANCLF